MLLEVRVATEGPTGPVEHYADGQPVEQPYWEWLYDVYVRKRLVNACDLGPQDINKEITVLLAEEKVCLTGRLAATDGHCLVVARGEMHWLDIPEDPVELHDFVQEHFGGRMYMGGTFSVKLKDACRCFLERTP